MKILKNFLRYRYICWKHKITYNVHGWKRYKAWYLETLEWIGSHPEKHWLQQDVECEKCGETPCGHYPICCDCDPDFPCPTCLQQEDEEE